MLISPINCQWTHFKWSAFQCSGDPTLIFYGRVSSVVLTVRVTMESYDEPGFSVNIYAAVNFA
jgi:hypothetical protein